VREFVSESSIVAFLFVVGEVEHHSSLLVYMWLCGVSVAWCLWEVHEDV